MNQKTNLILAASLMTATAGMSQTSKNFQYAVKEISIAPFHAVTIHAAIDVVLVQNDDVHAVYLEGAEQLAKEISVTVQHDELVIDGKKDRSYRGRLQLTIPVQQLQKITVNGQGTVAFLH